MNPVAKKLQFKPDKRWLIYHAPAGYPELLEPLPEGASITAEASGTFDGVLLFAKNSADLTESLVTVSKVLKPDTVFWVSYPKQSSAIKSDLKMMGNWDELKKYGLDGVASVAIDETWAASRFRPLGQAKRSETCADDIRNNEYGEYIDVDKKQIRLPADMESILTAELAAYNHFQSLSYSNKKEYVLWILTAKQEKTRTERLNKMTEKLLAGKKNPAEK